MTLMSLLSVHRSSLSVTGCTTDVPYRIDSAGESTSMYHSRAKPLTIGWRGRRSPAEELPNIEGVASVSCDIHSIAYH